MTRKDDLERIAALGDDDRAWLRALGVALYGSRWQRPLAEAMGISSGYVNRLMSEGATALPITSAFRGRLADFVEDEMPKRLEAYQYQAALLASAAARFRSMSGN